VDNGESSETDQNVGSGSWLFQNAFVWPRVGS
jgi:hypothetical protein